MNGTTMKVYRFIESYERENGWAPTYQEMAAALGLRSRSNIAYHVQRLVKAGLVVKPRNIPRAIRLVEGAWGG